MWHHCEIFKIYCHQYHRYFVAKLAPQNIEHQFAEKYLKKPWMSCLVWGLTNTDVLINAEQDLISPFQYQNEKVMWLIIHKCFDFILIWARSFLKQLQHNINDNIVFQAFINTTTLLKCPDFPSIYNRYTTICLKTLDISIYRDKYRHSLIV